jgi:hypothetical protein
MNLRLPWEGLRYPALLLLGALALGGALLGLGLSIHARGESGLREDTAREAAAARRVREATSRLAQDRREAPLFDRIRHSGFLGAGDRAGWVTALGQAQTALRLDSLSWRLAPRQPSALAPGLWVSSMELTASRVDAEGLDALLAHLRKTAPGRFTLERCALALDADGLAGQAECRLNWWTWEDAAARR